MRRISVVSYCGIFRVCCVRVLQNLRCRQTYVIVPIYDRLGDASVASAITDATCCVELLYLHSKHTI